GGGGGGGSEMQTGRPGARRNAVAPCDMAGRRIGAILDSDQKKFTEPVALSSPEPVGFPLPRTAPRPGFDLLALRARCKRHTTRPANPLQEGEKRKACHLHIFRFDPGRQAIRAACSKRLDQKNSPSRLRFRPPNRLTFRLRVRPPDSASTYSRSVLGAGGNVDGEAVALKTRRARKDRSLISRSSVREAAGRGWAALSTKARGKKFTEPVALSSPQPTDLPLPRTTSRLGFDLLAPRARCKRQSRRRGWNRQGLSQEKSAQFARNQLSTFPPTARGSGDKCRPAPT